MNIAQYVRLTLLVIAFSLATQVGRADTTLLFSRIAERLSWMEPVAAWKHANDVPVEDLDREAVVLDAVVAEAAAHGLDADSVRAFFQAQINAAKVIQFCSMDRWQSGAAKPAKTPDLVEDIRPELLRLGDEIVTSLADNVSLYGRIPTDAEDSFRKAVSLECLDEATQTALFESLMEVRSAQ